MRKYQATTILYLLVLVVVIASMKTKINEFKKQNIELLEKNEKLTRQLQEYKSLLTSSQYQRNRLLDIIDLLRAENEELRTIRAKVTSYSPLDNRDGQQAQGNPSRSSIGRKVGRHLAAADPERLPYGTKLYIPEYGIVEIGDTGGALRRDKKNIRIDVFSETYEQAMEWGVKDLEVKILEWGGNDN